VVSSSVLGALFVLALAAALPVAVLYWSELTGSGVRPITGLSLALLIGALRPMYQVAVTCLAPPVPKKGRPEPAAAQQCTRGLHTRLVCFQ
jgi:hypothetical protein